MTIYRAAWAHVALLLAITAVGVVVSILTERSYGHSTVPFVLTALALLAANSRLGRYACPRCGSNLFVRRRIAMPWPNRRCSRCGLDLGKPES